GMGGHLVTKFVKQTKIDSRLADKASLHQIALVETQSEKRTGSTRILGEADAAVRQEQSRLNPTYRVVDQGLELLPLLVRDGGPRVLDFHHALTDKDDLSDFIDAGHPGIKNPLRCPPLLKQDCRRVFVTKQSRHSLLEAAAEEHGGAGVFFLPAVQIAMVITARAGQVLRNLGVAVIHGDALSFSVPFPLAAGRIGIAVASSSHWLAGAKPSKFTSEIPLTTVWLILTTPTKPRRARSSHSSWLNSSGSWRKSRRNQPSFHIAFGVQ